jgi:hypothetical protein
MTSLMPSSSSGLVGGGTGPPPPPPLSSGRIPGGATEILYKGMRFLITERPTDFAMGSYLEELKRFNVNVVVRVCESSYDTQKLTDNGIEVIDLSFPDGQAPSQQVTHNTQSHQDSYLALTIHHFSAFR